MQYPLQNSWQGLNFWKRLSCALPVFILAVITVPLRAQTVLDLRSPDGRILMQLSAKQQQVRYAIHYEGQQLASGNIGFVMDTRSIFGADAKTFEQISANTKQRHTLQTRGNHNTAEILCNMYKFKVLSVDGKTDFRLDVRLYNNGIAYRYSVPAGGRSLDKETGQITLPGSATLWWQQDVHTYEGNYQSAPFDQLGDSLKLGMPLTLRYPDGLYASLCEANIFGFAGSYLTHYKNNKTLDYTLAGPVSPQNSDTLRSGWQIMTISKDLNGLVNNDIVSDVSTAPDKALYPQGLKTAWIQPGQSIWTWMSKKRDVTPENIRRFTDYAANLGIPYNLIDDGWVLWNESGKDHWQILKEQVDYAKSKGVGIWVWQAYPPHNGTPGLKDTTYMRTFFETCASLGVKGMKIDFINAETQEKIDFYQRAARLAAYYHLMVDFHGADKGTGIEYTYPNVLSQEGIRGLEQEDNQHWPYLNTVLPFTRYLSGPADYTPVSFAPYVSSTTMAHQVATAAVFTSPFLCLGADPEDLSKSVALPFIQQIPATWDETLVLKESKIGETAVFARRKGKTWYLAILNGGQPRSLSIDLSFLDNKKYTLAALEDQSASRISRVTRNNSVSKKTSLHIELPAGGGYLGILKR